MPIADRNANIISHIRKYCIEVETAHTDFSYSKDRFMVSSTYRNAVTMPILQIGELSNHVSETFKKLYPQIPWNEMRGLQNIMAHQYASVDFDIIWDTSTKDIPALKRFCDDFLSDFNKP